jgi:uncharacterized cupin superfamily protein
MRRMETINIFRAENLEGRVDVARSVGSAETLMFIYDLAPGQGSSPYHYEYEEEWLLVVDGTVVVRAPDGEHTLERGDLVRFPPGPAGAHKVMNRSDSPARTLLFSSSRRCRGHTARRAGTRPSDDRCEAGGRLDDQAFSAMFSASPNLSTTR